MTKKLVHLLLCVAFAGLTTLWAVAQDESSNSKSEVRTMTGCLTKAGGGDEFLLTATDGSTWEIHENNAVNLAAHVNQTVEVNGVVAHEKTHNMKEDAKEMGHDTGMKNNTAEHGHLKVTKLHKVSSTCSQ